MVWCCLHPSVTADELLRKSHSGMMHLLLKIHTVYLCAGMATTSLKTRTLSVTIAKLSNACSKGYATTTDLARFVFN